MLWAIPYLQSQHLRKYGIAEHLRLNCLKLYLELRALQGASHRKISKFSVLGVLSMLSNKCKLYCTSSEILSAKPHLYIKVSDQHQ